MFGFTVASYSIPSYMPHPLVLSLLAMIVFVGEALIRSLEMLCPVNALSYLQMTQGRELGVI